MTAEQERKAHKKAEIKSFQERKNNRKQKKTKGGIYDV